MKNEISSIFPKVIVSTGEEDVNEVVICPLYDRKETERVAAKLSELNKEPVKSKKSAKSKANNQSQIPEKWLVSFVDEFKNLQVWAE